MKIHGKFPLWYDNKEIFLYYTLDNNKISQVFIKINDFFDETLSSLVVPYIENKILIENNFYISLPNILKACYDERAKLGITLMKKECEKTIHSLEKVIAIKKNEIEANLKKTKLFSLKNKEEELLDENGQLSSYIFAKKFNKKHEHIMSVIKKIKNSFGEEFFKNNFFSDKFEINNRYYPMFTMNKNGFIVLISQLNKIKDSETSIPFVIQQFDNYNKNIAITVDNYSSPDTKKSCRNDRKLLNLLVNDCAKELGVDTFKIWEKIHNRFEINTITNCSVDMIAKIERYAEFLLMEIRMQNMIKQQFKAIQ